MTTRKKMQPREHPAQVMQNVAVAVERRLVAINSEGHRIGEDHHRSVISDHEVELMRTMYEEFDVGHPKHMGFRQLAKIFERPKATVVKICKYQIRAQHAARFKRVT